MADKHQPAPNGRKQPRTLADYQGDLKAEGGDARRCKHCGGQLTRRIAGFLHCAHCGRPRG